MKGASAPQPCGGGTHANQTVLNITGYLSSLDECVICPAGTSCSVGTDKPVPCLPGSFSAASQASTCDLCPAGKFQRLYGQTACIPCTPGFYCRAGAAEPTPCPAGTVGNATGLYSENQCTYVLAGFWAPLGSNIPKPCPPSGFYCPGALRDTQFGGAEPIIMPIGQSTETQEVQAVTQSMSLDISIDDFAAQRTALIAKLAAQYGVDPSLISLEATTSSSGQGRRLQSSGGIELTITIATSDGKSAGVDLATLNQRVSAIDDTALATSIGAVMGAPVTVSGLQQSTASVKIEVEFVCPKGKWCTAGLVVNCPLGTYNPLEKQDFATACILCPPNSITLETNSTSRAACVCDAGFYDVNSSLAVDPDLLATTTNNGNPVSMMADVVQCLVCPIGTNCTAASTLEGMPLLGGYFRLDNATVDVRVCPDARKGCSTTFGTAACKSRSGCKGGAGNPCADKLSGPTASCATTQTGHGSSTSPRRTPRWLHARTVAIGSGRRLGWLRWGSWCSFPWLPC